VSALCSECGKPLYPSADEDRCRLCIAGIAGFAPGRVIYRKQKQARAA
jgi:predicted amidophosphoribosyltransferase